HEGRREEDADLAELDLFGVVVVAGRAQDDQLDVPFVGLELRPHVEGLRVLDRQLVQAEGVTDLGKLRFSWFEQPQPYETALAAPGRGLVQGNGAFVASVAVQVMGAVNDHRGGPPSRLRNLVTRYPASPNPDP